MKKIASLQCGILLSLPVLFAVTTAEAANSNNNNNCCDESKCRNVASATGSNLSASTTDGDQYVCWASQEVPTNNNSSAAGAFAEDAGEPEGGEVLRGGQKIEGLPLDCQGVPS